VADDDEELLLWVLVDAIQRYGRERAAASYAGWWWESPPGVVAAFTRDLDEHRARLLRLTASPERLEVRSARYSDRELRVIHDRLARDCNWLDEEGVDLQMWEVSPEGNCVLVEVIAPEPEAATRMMYAYYGDRVRVEVVATGY
jgi:hypothetical protein